MTRMMTEAERREVLEEIARDETSYPRDKIAAIKLLDELARREEPPPTGIDDELGRELDRMIGRHRVD